MRNLTWHRIKRIRTWQLLVLFVVATVMTALSLRQNNLRMVDLREQVKQADQRGGDTMTALKNLRSYVTSHMNSDVGQGVYLEGAYQRAYNRALQDAEKSGAESTRAYQQADAECQPVFIRTGSFQAYLQCASSTVAASGSAKDPLLALKVPAADLYRYNFASPRWSPDAAGWWVIMMICVGSLVACRAAFLVAIYWSMRRI